MDDGSMENHFYHDVAPHNTPLTIVMYLILACPKRYSRKANIP